MRFDITTLVTIPIRHVRMRAGLVPCTGQSTERTITLSVRILSITRSDPALKALLVCVILPPVVEKSAPDRLSFPVGPLLQHEDMGTPIAP